jgi:hypothetical protein
VAGRGWRGAANQVVLVVRRVRRRAGGSDSATRRRQTPRNCETDHLGGGRPAASVGSPSVPERPGASMRLRGFEPPRARAHTDLNRACIPVSPQPLGPCNLATVAGRGGAAGLRLPPERAGGAGPFGPFWPIAWTMRPAARWYLLSRTQPPQAARARARAETSSTTARRTPPIVSVTRSERHAKLRSDSALPGRIQSVSPLSSRGLGRRPLTAETRVRIPVAVLQNPRVFGGFVVVGVVRHSVRHSRYRLRRV